MLNEIKTLMLSILFNFLNSINLCTAECCGQFYKYLNGGLKMVDVLLYYH